LVEITALSNVGRLNRASQIFDVRQRADDFHRLSGG
jgi:hypothetical protein